MHKKHIWIAVAFLAAVTGTVFAVAIPPNLPVALEAQQKLAQERPTDAKVANDLGNLLHMAGHPDQAEEAYRHAAELSPEDPVPHYNLGLLLQEKGKEKAALKQFVTVAKYDPSNAWAHFQIGAINERFGNRSEAIKALAMAFRLDPTLADPSANPQIIESQLVYEAMVRGYRESGSRSMAPKVYDDPNRIARLLVAASDAESFLAENEMDEDAPMEAGAGEVGGLPAMEEIEAGTSAELREYQDEEDEVAPSPGRQVLTPDNIERGSALGQVNSPSRGARSTRRPTTSTRDRTRTGGSTRGFRPPGASDAARTRPGRVRFEPSIQSTGSLDLELRTPSEGLPRPS